MVYYSYFPESFTVTFSHRQGHVGWESRLNTHIMCVCVCRLTNLWFCGIFLGSSCSHVSQTGIKAVCVCVFDRCGLRGDVRQEDYWSLVRSGGDRVIQVFPGVITQIHLRLEWWPPAVSCLRAMSDWPIWGDLDRSERTFYCKLNFWA